MAIHSHEPRHNPGKEEWLTPPKWTAALGPFDTDPCAPIIRPWPTASLHWTVEDDGLSQEWVGLVWLNPPFTKARAFLERLRRHEPGGIALLAARTDTEVWRECVWESAAAVCFVHGRPHFHHVNGDRAGSNSGFPVALAAYGGRAVQRLRAAGLGPVVTW